MLTSLHCLKGHSEAVEGAFVDFRERFIGWDASNVSLSHSNSLHYFLGLY